MPDNFGAKENCIFVAEDSDWRDENTDMSDYDTEADDAITLS